MCSDTGIKKQTLKLNTYSETWLEGEIRIRFFQIGFKLRIKARFSPGRPQTYIVKSGLDVRAEPDSTEPSDTSLHQIIWQRMDTLSSSILRQTAPDMLCVSLCLFMCVCADICVYVSVSVIYKAADSSGRHVSSIVLS